MLNVTPDYLTQGVRLITNIWSAAELGTQTEDVELTPAIELDFTATEISSSGEQATPTAPPKAKLHQKT